MVQRSPSSLANLDDDASAGSFAGLDHGAAAQHFSAFRHANQTEARARAFAMGRREAAAIVFNRQAQVRAIVGYANFGFAGLRMLENIADSFLDDPIEADFQLARKEAVNVIDRTANQQRVPLLKLANE